MSFGIKYIPSKFYVNDILTQFNFALDLFIYKIDTDYNKSMKFFNDWKSNILNKINFELHAKTSKNNHL